MMNLGFRTPPKNEMVNYSDPKIPLYFYLVFKLYLRTQYNSGVMDPPAPFNKKQLIEMNSRFRKGQTFYQELTKLIKVFRKRPYYAPFIFLW